jgi:hypothetical protein
MKRWLTVGAAAIGIFAIGVFAGVLLSSKTYSHQFKAECLALFNDKSVVGFSMMNFLASGHVDWVYDLVEGDATSCLAVHSSDLQACIARLKHFYEQHPERQASLEQRHPDAARALGYAKTP